MLKIKLEKLQYYLLLIFAFFAPFETVLQLTYKVPGIFKIYYIFMGIGIFLICLYPKIFLKQGSIDKSFMTLFGIFIFWIFVGILVNTYQSDMFVSFYANKQSGGFYGAEMKSFMTGFIRTIITLLFIAVLFLFTRKKICRQAIIKGFYALAIITCCYSLYQFIGTFFHWPYTSLFLLGSDYRPEGSFNFGIRRVEGVFYEPGPQATFLSPFVILFISIILSKYKIFKIKRTGKFILLGLFLTVLFFTLSPIAFISLALAWLFYFLLNFKKTFNLNFLKNLSIGLIVVFLFFSLVLSFVTKNLGNIDIGEIGKFYLHKVIEGTFTLSNNSYEYSNFDNRSVKVYSGLQLFKHNPIFGVGLGNSDLLFFKYIPFTSYSNAIPAINNEYALMLAEVGLPGFIIFLLILFYPILLFMKKKRMIDKSENKYFYQGLIISYSTIFLVSCNSFPYFWRSFFLLYYIMVVQYLRFINQDEAETKQDSDKLLSTNS